MIRNLDIISNFKYLNLLRRIRIFLPTAILLLGMILQGCSDELDTGNGKVSQEFDGFIHLKVNVPDATLVKTRSDGEKVTAEKLLSEDCKHYVLVYKKSGETYSLLHQESVDLSGSSPELAICINKNENLEDLKIIIVANVPDTPAETSKFENIDSDFDNLFDLTTGNLESDESPLSPFVMSALAVPSQTAGYYIVSLQRSAAKISVELSERVEGFVIQEFSMYNAPSSGYYAAYVAEEESKIDKVYRTGSNILTANAANDFESYTYPVTSLGKSGEINGENAGAYFIVKGEYKGDIGYYRVDLRDYSGSNYYDISPNHWYQIEIVEVNRKGYSSAEEAAKRYMGFEQDELDKEPALKAVIHDHVAEVVSMTTDGIRELGTVESVEMSEDSYSLIVKCYSPYDMDYALSESGLSGNLQVDVIEGDDWLIVGDPTPVTASTSGNHEGDRDNEGKQWSFPLQFKNKSLIFTDKSALILVTWKGLSRKVLVTYNADFKPSEVCSVDLRYKWLSDESKEDPHGSELDYWDFLDHMLGLREGDMADGKVRNEGFHFPMPYGEDDEWVYIYDIKFKTTYKDVTFTTSGDSFFKKENLSWEYDINSRSGVLRLASPKKGDFTYAIGTITFKMVEDNGVETDFSVSLYHTGFFDYSSPLNQCFYYEVVNLGGKYWLDRNIGAKSNKMYVDNGGSSSAGNPEAGGYYFKIANEGKYEDPIIKGDDFSDAGIKHVCPPGYRIPNVAEWDALRLSSNFKTTHITEGDAMYMATYYSTGLKEQGNIYFPKSRFYDNFSLLAKLGNGRSEQPAIFEFSPNSGDAGSGYYWTSTPSSGLEKDEIGAWLKVLNLIGSSNTYVNGSVKYHEMNVRCISKYSREEESKYSVAFNVKGATHVYLYTVDSNGSKRGLFTFPGKAIGSASSVNNLEYDYGSRLEDFKNSYLHFSYTGSLPDKDLYVFFVYVSDNGEMRIISENNNGTLSGANGWPVKTGYNYFFTKGENIKPVKNLAGEFPWKDWNGD